MPVQTHSSFQSQRVSGSKPNGLYQASAFASLRVTFHERLGDIDALVSWNGDFETIFARISSSSNVHSDILRSKGGEDGLTKVEMGKIDARGDMRLKSIL